MTTSSTNTTIAHTSDATFQTWVAEVIAQILAVGLTQTTDTGQINTATVTRPATNTSGGYAIFRFNDTLQSTTPIFIKLEFGTGSSATGPSMWVTFGTGSNGSGTLNGVVGTRVSMGSVAPTSTVIPYASRFCYSATAGFFGMVFKIGGIAIGANGSMFGLFIFRSCDNTGATTSDSFMLITNSSSATSSSSGVATMQAISHLTGLAYLNVAPMNAGSAHGAMPFSASTTLYLGNAQVGLIFQLTPILGISPLVTYALLSEIGVGSTVAIVILGSTSHTYIGVGFAMGGSINACLGSSAMGYLMLWE